MGHIKVNGRKVTNPLARVLIPTTALLFWAFVAAIVICGILIATGLVFVVSILVLILTVGAMLLYAAVRIAVTGSRYFANWNENRRR